MYYSDYNRPPEEREPVIETNQYHVYEAQPQRKKKRGAAKIVAIALCCALLGGAAGAGGALAYGHFAGGTSTIYQSSTPTTAVSLANVDGHTVLTPEEIYAANLGAAVGVNGNVTTNVWGYTVKNPVSGSGFVISSNATTSYILTNYHVIDGVSDIKVFFADGKSYDATLVGGEQENDIAVLKIDAANLSPAKLGDSDSLTVGDTIYAVGNPLGDLEFSMSTGHVSALDRVIKTEESSESINMFQIDAAVNSGNSGGPVYNDRGEVIGVVTAKYSDTGVEGIGFAIPINDASSIAQDLITKGYVTGKAYMGVKLDERYNAMYSQYYGMPLGAYVYSVDAGSSADEAGLRAGDIITRLGDAEVTCYDDLHEAVKDFSAGDTTEVGIYRAGEDLSISITFDELTPYSTSDSPARVLPAG